MNWITEDMLKTVAGAASSVALVTMLLKAITPTITGRTTQLVALVLSLVIAGVIGDWTSVSTGLVSALNGAVICATAMGIDQAVNYKKTV